jgi:chorismate mutase / prephenate dehydratase
MEPKHSLEEIRNEIDKIDTELLRLLNERADLVHEIGTIKRNAGLSIYAPEREESLLQALTQKNKGRLPAEAVRAIYREIMSASLALEKDLTIAFLGPEATWTHQAARSKFGLSVKYAPESSISDVFARVTRGTADYGVVPIENSVEGAVNHTLDVFMDSELKIVPKFCSVFGMISYQSGLVTRSKKSIRIRRSLVNAGSGCRKTRETLN